MKFNSLVAIFIIYTNAVPIFEAPIHEEILPNVKSAPKPIPRLPVEIQRKIFANLFEMQPTLAPSKEYLKHSLTSKYPHLMYNDQESVNHAAGLHGVFNIEHATGEQVLDHLKALGERPGKIIKPEQLLAWIEEGNRKEEFGAKIVKQVAENRQLELLKQLLPLEVVTQEELYEAISSPRTLPNLRMEDEQKFFDYLFDFGVHPGSTLSYAAFKENPDLVEFLLKDLRVDPSYDNNFALRISAFNGNAKIAEMLMHRVDPSVPDNEPVMAAIQQNRFEVFEVLMRDKRVSNELLIQFAFMGNADGIKDFLQEYKVDDEILHDALTQAAAQGHLDVVTMLLDYRLSANPKSTIDEKLNVNEVQEELNRIKSGNSALSPEEQNALLDSMSEKLDAMTLKLKDQASEIDRRASSSSTPPPRTTSLEETP